MYKTAVAVLLVCAAIPAYFLRKLRILHVDGVCSSIYWTTRSWLWNNPFPQVYHEWYDSCEQEKYWESRIQLIRVWAFLRPFFATHGYDLYVFKNPDNISEELFPSSTSVVFTAEAAFPYGRCLYKDNMATGFVYSSLRVWPARDRHGRDVVIKAISTKELQALRLLQSDALKNDPQNHTIPVLEFLDFAGQAFVVMARWDGATCADFVKVGELVRYGRAFFEVVAFLHRNGIGHGDISLQNMAMDLILPILFDTCVAGVRGPERRYALIDFETARLVDVDQRLDDEPLLIPAIFKRDIKMFARSAEINLRCIQDVLPELEPLFVAMHDINGPTQPTAAAALARFEEMCSTLSTEDLERSVEAISWTGGRTIYRKGPPVYYE